MSLAELLTDVLSLSRSDKLRLIQTLAEDLVTLEEPPSTPGDRRDVEVEEEEIQEDAHVHAVDSRNDIGRREEEMTMNDPDNVNITESEQKLMSLFVVGHPLPVRFPDESYEAAAVLMKLLEAEKSAK